MYKRIVRYGVDFRTNILSCMGSSGVIPAVRPSCRGPSSSPARLYSQDAPGPSPSSGLLSLRAFLLTVFAGTGIVAAARYYEQQRMDRFMQESQTVVGKAAVGGPFSLIDQDGKPFSDRDLLGEFSLMYFGFTHCPDICPDELEKLSESLDLIEKQSGRQVQAVFITVDPDRDSPSLVKQYVKEFHPRMIGLTGPMEEITRTSKSFRVYFHKTTDDPQDYLVDHSIIIYLMDPKGNFVTFYGKNNTSEQLATSILGHMNKWAEQHPEYGKLRGV